MLHLNNNKKDTQFKTYGNEKLLKLKNKNKNKWGQCQYRLETGARDFKHKKKKKMKCC